MPRSKQNHGIRIGADGDVGEIITKTAGSFGYPHRPQSKKACNVKPCKSRGDPEARARSRLKRSVERPPLPAAYPQAFVAKCSSVMERCREGGACVYWCRRGRQFNYQSVRYSPPRFAFE